jgi:hypothetical protein
MAGSIRRLAWSRDFGSLVRFILPGNGEVRNIFPYLDEVRTNAAC